MTIELPYINPGSQPRTSTQARIEIACGRYAGRAANPGRSAKIAGLCFTDFTPELGKRCIGLNDTAEDIGHDLRMTDELAANVAVAA